jgi:hypothetical protein
MGPNAFKGEGGDVKEDHIHFHVEEITVLSKQILF